MFFLSTLRDKYERKIEKLMIFIYNIMQSNGTPAIGYLPKKEIEMGIFIYKELTL
jgi:hypothetical protein